MIYAPKEAHSRIFVTAGDHFSRDKCWPKKTLLGAASLYRVLGGILVRQAEAQLQQAVSKWFVAVDSVSYLVRI